jgi:hypothetical protein
LRSEKRSIWAADKRRLTLMDLLFLIGVHPRSSAARKMSDPSCIAQFRGVSGMSLRLRGDMMAPVFRFSSVALAVLLAFGAVWGECASCPLIAARKHCCGGHSGSCQMPSPKAKTPPVCPNAALAPVSHHNTQVSGAQLVAHAPVGMDITSVEVCCEPVAGISVKPDTGPPGLYLLNSALRV